MPTLRLASASPRRQEILLQLGAVFEVCPAKAEQPLDPNLPPEQAVMAVARAKAEEVALTGRGAVLGADTVVMIDGVPLGKPRNEDDAAAMLCRLSGKTHRVITGVWLCTANGSGEGFSATAEVTFAVMDKAEIAAYIATGEPADKAGAYGIQGIGARYIEKIDGDFYTVMGLPAQKTYALLRRNGLLLL